MKYTTKALLIALALPLAATAQTTTILSDNFNDNDRTNQSLTSSAQWFSSTGVGGGNLSLVETTTGNFALKNSPTSGTIRHTVAYFAPSNAPVTLAASGDTLSVSFNLTPTSASPSDALNVLRVGLLNSGANRQTADASSPDLALTGYGFFVNPASQRVRINGRSGDAGPLFSSLSSGNGWVGGTGVLLDDDTPTDTFAMAQNTVYTISIAIARLANGNLDITYSTTDGVNSVSSTFIDTSYLSYGFDTIGFGWGDAFGDGLIDNVLINHTAASAIPEPSAAAALAGLVVAGMALVRRRRR